jgi:hypothetical protein
MCDNRVKSWYKAYQENTGTKRVLDENTLMLIKYFISSNASFTELQNPYLKQLIGKFMHVPTIFCFRDMIMTTVLGKMYEMLEKKLQNAMTVCLIVDIWTNAVNADFIGLAAVLTNEKLEREVHVINMMRMPGPHCAEVIKSAVEAMVNRFDFDKSRIHGTEV